MSTAQPGRAGRARLCTVLAVVALGILGGASPALAVVTSAGGGAYAVSAGLSGLVNATVGPLSPVTAPATTGGPVNNDLIAADITAAATAGIAVAGNAQVADTTCTTSSVPGGGGVGCSANLANTALGLAALGLPALFAADAVSSACTAQEGTVTGLTSLANATAATGLLGASVALAAAPAPNTTLLLLNALGVTVGSIILNEQISGANSITVNAVHITLAVPNPLGGTLQTGDIVIASSSCSVSLATPVTVRSFSASPSKHGVLLRWQTASRANLLGFNVYRERAGHLVRVSKHLIAARGAARGYSFLDRSIKANRSSSASYRLQAVSLDGSRAWSGSARVAR